MRVPSVSHQEGSQPDALNANGGLRPGTPPAVRVGRDDLADCCRARHRRHDHWLLGGGWGVTVLANGLLGRSGGRLVGAATTQPYPRRPLSRQGCEVSQPACGRRQVASSTSRTLRARAAGVKGFCRKVSPGSSIPWCSAKRIVSVPLSVAVSFGGGSASAGSTTRGKYSLKVVPRPGSLYTQM